jgi:hypothetical protein
MMSTGIYKNDRRMIKNVCMHTAVGKKKFFLTIFFGQKNPRSKMKNILSVVKAFLISCAVAYL